MWLKNGRHSTHTENRNAWHGVHLVLLFVLILLVSHTFGEITFPSERDDLVVKDSNRLLSPDFLPFLNECNTPDADLELCTMYYDTVYNIYQFKPNADEIKAEILAASQKLDTMTDSFCELFPGEVSVAIDQHPFSSINNINITWIQRKSVCTLRCMQLIPPAAVEIKPVCKFISGGCKWITKRKHTSEPIDTNGSLGANPIAKPAEPINREPKVNKVIDINPGAELNQIINPNANPIANVKIDETQNAGPNVNEALNNKPSINVTVTKIASIPIQSGKQTGETITRMDTKQAPNSPPIEPKKSMVTPTLNKSSQSPSTVVISKPSKAKETIPAPVPVQPETEDKPININPNDNNMPASNPNDADKNYNDPNFDDDAKPEDDTEQGKYCNSNRTIQLNSKLNETIDFFMVW